MTKATDITTVLLAYATPENILIALAGLGALAVVAIFFLLLTRRPPDTSQADAHLATLAQIQAETAGRLQSLGETLAGRQAELARVLHERLDHVSENLSQSLQSQTRNTVDSLTKLNERIAVIDSAQKNLGELTSQVTSLRDVLSNKQLRGAFGQGRMEVIVRDGLPQGAYEFQFTLSNRSRPDCCVFLPDQRPLIIDAKFPLEAITAFREAKNDDERKNASQRIRQDINKHINDISGKYLIAGETQDLALMFVPSESVYAELHDHFDDIIQKAYRARVIIVSPSLLMLAIQVIQQIQKDARMRAAADKIRTEVGAMAKDLGLLRDRVMKLQQHFGQANEDVRQILISADKVEKRAHNIEELEFDSGPTDATTILPSPLARKLPAAE